MCFSCCVWSRSLMCYFFFFKQKTAYEMRISDWSSDVCSSDLLSIKARALRGRGIAGGDRIELALNAAPQTNRLDIQLTLDAPANGLVSGLTGTTKGLHMQIGGKGRSEEHTSELQSLMRISYADFCLKKKTKPTN